MSILSIAMAFVTAATVSIIIYHWPAKASGQQVPISKINECFQREIDSCGDKICEMSYDDNSEIIKQLWKNVIDCIEGEVK